MLLVVLLDMRVYTVEKEYKQLRWGPITLFNSNIRQKFKPLVYTLAFNNALRLYVHISYQ
jgi:hypothetical protein